MRIRFFFILVLPLLLANMAHAKKAPPQEVQVADPYIELHTGPGRGYPIFYVAERGEWIMVLARKTDWFKIRTRKGKEGWVSREQMEKTVTASGKQTRFKRYSKAEFSQRRWEAGFNAGQFNDSPIISIYGGFAFSPNLSAELALSQVLDKNFTSNMIQGRLLAQPFAHWRFSPYFALGAGYMESRATGSLIQPIDKSNQFSLVGLGLRTYITRRFIFRLEYNAYLLYTASVERDKNEDIREWKAGFSVFF